MKRFTSAVAVSTCLLMLGIVSPAFGNGLPCTIGDVDGFGMGSHELLGGDCSLLQSLISSGVRSSNIQTLGGSCESHVYKAFTSDGTANKILHEGDCLPDVKGACHANGDSTFIPYPLTAAPSTVRTTSFTIHSDPPADYEDYYRGSNPLLTCYPTGPNTDCWDNRSEEELRGEASFTDITLSPSFDDAWPHLVQDYPWVDPDTPPEFITFHLSFWVPDECPLYLYFPIGDYDAGDGATVSIRSTRGSNTGTSLPYSLTKQDNTQHQGLIQGVCLELFTDGVVGCGMPVYDTWEEIASPNSEGGYDLSFNVILEMNGDPYYAIDYLTIDSTVKRFGVKLVGPSREYTTIQSAISAASTGDTIIVDPGTYHENISFLGKTITLAKWPDPASGTCAKPEIHGDAANSVVTFTGSEGVGASLRGFKITNGGGSYGAAVYGNGSVVHIEDCDLSFNDPGPSYTTLYGGALYNVAGYVNDCTFTNNFALAAGAVYIAGYSPQFVDCTFGSTDAAQKNSSWGNGGAVYCQGVSGRVTAPMFSRCGFLNNTGGAGGAMFVIGASSSNQATPSLVNCQFSQNSVSGASQYGGALSINSFSTVKVTNCTFKSNTTVKAAGGGAAYVNGVSGGAATLNVNNSLFWGDTSAGATSEIVTGTYGVKSLRYSFVQGEADNSTTKVYGSTTYNPALTWVQWPASTGPWYLKPNNSWVGYFVTDTLNVAPPNDIRGENRPKPNGDVAGTKVDFGSYEEYMD